MEQKPFSLEEIVRYVEQNDIIVEREVHRFSAYNVDLVFPCVIITLCLRGSAHALYDMQDMRQTKNELGLIMPGHIMHPIECSDDYTFARLIISAKMFNELQEWVFGWDAEKFHKAPMCRLTDEQAARLLTIIEQLEYINSHSEEEMPLRYQIMQSLLVVGHGMLNLFRQEQDRQWLQDRRTGLFARFSELVVAHYTETRDAKYYAEQLHLSPKHFTKLIREATNGISPFEWIEQYVITQAKRRILQQPERTLQQISYDLGFCEPTAFHRYFKRVTGMTAREYRLLNQP